MRLRRSFVCPALVLAALAPIAGRAQSTPADTGRPAWMLGLGAMADEHDAHSEIGSLYLGVGSRTWLTFVAGASSSPVEGMDVEADTLLIGVDHRFDTVGFTLEAERWGDSGTLETQDYSGSVYLERERWRLSFGYESRDIDLPFTATGPLGGTFRGTVGVPSDGISLNARASLAERWRLYFGLTEYDYERNLEALPRLANLGWLSTSTLTLASTFLDHDRWVSVERSFGPTLLNVRYATDRSAIDESELDTFEASLLFPVGRRFDLEVTLGEGRSQLFDAGVYGGLMLLVYGL